MRQLVLLACMVGILFSCSEKDPLLTDEMASSDYALPIDEAYENSTLFLSEVKNNTPDTRSAGVAINDAYTKKTTVLRKVNIDAARQKTRNTQEEVPVYLFDYQTKEGEPNGFVIMIGDKRFDDGIFAFSESNNFGSFDEGMGDFWLDRIDGLMYGVVNGKTKMKEEIHPLFFCSYPFKNQIGPGGVQGTPSIWELGSYTIPNPLGLKK